MKRLMFAAVLYGALLAASLATLSDWRIRLATAAVILMFAARTLWQPRRSEVVAPWGRVADQAGSGAPQHEGSSDGPGPM